MKFGKLLVIEGKKEKSCFGAALFGVTCWRHLAYQNNILWVVEVQQYRLDNWIKLDELIDYDYKWHSLYILTCNGYMDHIIIVMSGILWIILIKLIFV